MNYLIVKGTNNATPESFQLTSTIDKPRIHVNGSYIPLTTNPRMDNCNIKIPRGDKTYYAMRTSTSSYSQSASASATFNTTANVSAGLSNTTALTRASTYATLTRASTSATYTRASTSATLTRASTSATLTRASTYETLTRESVYAYSGYSTNSVAQEFATIHVSFTSGYENAYYWSMTFYATPSDVYAYLSDTQAAAWSDGPVYPSWYIVNSVPDYYAYRVGWRFFANHNYMAECGWNNGNQYETGVSLYQSWWSHRSEFTAFATSGVTNTVYYSAYDPTGMQGITNLTQQSIYGYNTRQSVSGYATRESVSGYATRESVSGYGTRESVSGYGTRSSISGYSGVSSSSSSSSESASGTCWK